VARGDFLPLWALTSMEIPRHKHHVDEFVLRLLCTGSTLCDLLAGLIEVMPADAYPGEEPEDVLIEMLCGTIRTRLDSVDPRDVRRATELIDQAGAVTLEHLQLASQLSRRMHSDGDAKGRAYG
jgi:hypothetical protein